jgi:glycyl-tRNA synthetase beta chain
MGLIREGNERVLAARLADAKFFFDEDRKVKLGERTTKLSGIIFHHKLGTLSDKTKRTKDLVESLAKEVGDAKCVVISRRAAELANNDIVTAVVGEFPNLQGVMGSEYARHDGEDPSVAIAIAERYLPRGMEGPIPQSLEGKLLSFADRLDKIAGFFRVGIVPKGSEDPYALRRDALSIVRILVEGNLSLKLEPALDKAEEILAKSNIEEVQVGIAQGPFDFIVERLRYYAGTAGSITRSDVIDAVLTPTNTHALSFKGLLECMKALESVTTKPEFDPLIVGFKRAHRLVEKEKWDRKPVDNTRFEHVTESALYQAIAEERAKMLSAMTGGDYGQALDALVRLKPGIDAFFTAVMVNAEDPAIRSNRLSLLQAVDKLFMSFADFSQIVVQGG